MRDPFTNAHFKLDGIAEYHNVLAMLERLKSIRAEY